MCVCIYVCVVCLSVRVCVSLCDYFYFCVFACECESFWFELLTYISYKISNILLCSSNFAHLSRLCASICLQNLSTQKSGFLYATKHMGKI